MLHDIFVLHFSHTFIEMHFVIMQDYLAQRKFEMAKVNWMFQDFIDLLNFTRIYQTK